MRALIVATLSSLAIGGGLAWSADDLKGAQSRRRAQSCETLSRLLSLAEATETPTPQAALYRSVIEDLGCAPAPPTPGGEGQPSVGLSRGRGVGRWRPKDYLIPVPGQPHGTIEVEAAQDRAAPTVQEPGSFCIDCSDTVQYTTQTSAHLTLTRFRGTHVQVLLPHSWIGSGGLSLEERRTLVDRLDWLYQQYEELLGGEPVGDGLDTIAFVPLTGCGPGAWGCGGVGYKGVEIVDADWSLEIVRSDLMADKAPEVAVHELCHNYDLFGTYLHYLPDHAHAWTDFMEAYISVYDRSGIAGLSPHELQAREIHQRYEPYADDPTSTWASCVRDDQCEDRGIVPNHSWAGVTHRFAQIHGPEAVRRFADFLRTYEASQPVPSTAEAKEDLHVEAMAAGAALNLGCYADAWRWQASTALRQRMSTSYGNSNSFCNDTDGDGFSALTGDCDDSKAAVNPGASETANGIDDDCDGLVDDVLHVEPNPGDFPSPLALTDPARVQGQVTAGNSDRFTFPLASPGRVTFVLCSTGGFEGWLDLYTEDGAYFDYQYTFAGDCTTKAYELPDARTWTFDVQAHTAGGYSLTLSDGDRWPAPWGGEEPPACLDGACELTSTTVTLSDTLDVPTDVRFWVSGVGFAGAAPYQSPASFQWTLPPLVQAGPYGSRAQLFKGETPVADATGPAWFDLTPALAIADAVPVPEGDSGTTAASFTVTLPFGVSSPVTVHYATANGSASSGSDYVPTSGVLTFDSGETTRTIDVTVKGDQLYENDETFSVGLSRPVNATIATGTAAGTILNDDPVPTLSVNDVSVSEGDAGSRSAVFGVTLSAPSSLATTVHYATADVTAAAGSDYTAVSGTLTFPPGTTSKTIAVPVKGDTTFEPSETFDVILGSPVNATIADGTGIGTIVNDDGAGTFQFSAASYSVTEATPMATITVNRVNGKQAGATVGYRTSDGTAQQPGDYASTSGTLTFGASQSSLTFKVPIVGDKVHEANETVLLSLDNPEPTATGATLGPRSTAVLTIVDNDPAPTIQLSAAAYDVSEGTGIAKVTVRRTGPLGTQVAVHYATSPGTATGGGTDYTDASGDLTFAASGPAAATQTILVPITQDTLAENPETFTVTLTSPTNGAVLGSPASATVTIVDDDASVGFSAASYTVNEATPKATILVKRTGTLLGTLTVPYATSTGTATGGGTDYGDTSGTLTFGPGVATQSFFVPIADDSIDEGTETVNLTLGPAPTWTLGTARIVGANPAALNITDNEATVQFSAGAYSVGEATKSVVISVRRTGTPHTGAATVHYATSDGTATAGSDYVPASGDLTFGAGQVAKTFAIGLASDTVAEGSQTINLTLSNPSGAALGTPSTAVVTIKDNDVAGRVQFSATDYSVDELGGTATITVTRTGGTSSDATVDYATENGTGLDGTDYARTSGTLTFGSGETSKTFPVTVLNDGMANGGVVKAVQLTLATPDNGLALGAPATATLWIVKE